MSEYSNATYAAVEAAKANDYRQFRPAWYAATVKLAEDREMAKVLFERARARRRNPEAQPYNSYES